MKYSKEQMYHFTCEECNRWWSDTVENNDVDKKTRLCPWCGYKHLPPHKDVTSSLNE